MSKIKVTGLKLETAKGKKIKLNIEEAKELYEQLDELFGENTTVVNNYPYYYWNRNWWNNSPYITLTGQSPSVWGNSTNTGDNVTTTGAVAYSFLSNSTGMKYDYEVAEAA